MKRARILILILLVLGSTTAAQDLKFAADRPFDLVHLRLEATVDLKAKTLAGRAMLDMIALRPGRVIRLDSIGLEISGVSVLAGEANQKQEARHTVDQDSLLIVLAQGLPRGTQVRVIVDYVCHDPGLGLTFFGPTKAEPDTPYQVWSQGETTDTRRWIPIFDNPNERLSSELIITAPAGFQVLSNGRLLSHEKDTWHWKQEKDHVPYLITLVVGKFQVTRDDWRGRPVEYWVPPDRAADTMRSFSNTKRMLDFFSDKIGVEYPWEKYAQIVVEQFRHGGMENTSATTLTERTLHDEKAAIDTSSDGLVAHELAHQWFGDLLTCRDWAHTWLNEGFATYFEALWSEENLGDAEFRYNMRGKAGGAINGGRTLPIVHKAYTAPWQQFDARAYPKGAWVLHMIRRRIGDAMWWKAIHHYVTKNAHRCVETVDLRKALEETTGESFERFFYDWTERPGNPQVEVTHHWDPGRQVVEVRVRQTQKEAAFHIPMRFVYRLPGGGKFTYANTFTDKDQRIYIHLDKAPESMQVDPDYALLMELTEKKARPYWLWQLTEDPDPIARIRAAEYFSKSRRDSDRRVLADALARETFWGVQAEIAAALGQSGGEVSRDVLLKGLSLENAKARKAVVDALAKFRDDETVASALEGIVVNGDASYKVESAAITAWAARNPPNAMERLKPLLVRDSHNDQIRNAALEALGQQRDARVTDLLLEWTARGKDRSTRGAALSALGKLARAAVWDRPTAARVAGVLADYLSTAEPRRVKTAAIATLRDLGENGDVALEALEALAAHDENDNVRTEAKTTIDKIRSGAPAHLELQRLREELRKLRESDRKLKEQLERMEHKQPVPVGG